MENNFHMLVLEDYYYNCNMHIFSKMRSAHYNKIALIVVAAAAKMMILRKFILRKFMQSEISVSLIDIFMLKGVSSNNFN